VRVRPASGEGEPVSDLLPVTLPESASPLGEGLLLRRGPSTGLAYAATADPRFRRNERLRLELPSNSSDVANARILDRAGTPMQVPATVSTRDEAPGQWKWIVVDVSLAPFAAGDYVVEVTQAGASQVAAFRIVP
jgi:hypothetical protein